jgi:hypothetical protein
MLHLMDIKKLKMDTLLPSSGSALRPPLSAASLTAEGRGVTMTPIGTHISLYILVRISITFPVGGGRTITQDSGISLSSHT